MSVPQNTSKVNKLNFCLDMFMLFLIGACCFLYSLLNKNFAEIRLELPFLPVPLFIGEFLLGTCIALSLLKWFLSSPRKLTKQQIAILIYFGFVTLKLLFGFWKYGPLAFRHAAMFYYPLFIPIVYDIFVSNDFFNRNFFVYFKALVFVASLVSVHFFHLHFFIFSYIVFVISIILSIRSRKIRIALLLFALLVIPWDYIYYYAKTVYVAATLAVLFFIITAMSLLNIKAIYKFLILAAMLVSFIALAYYVPGHEHKLTWDRLVKLKEVLTSQEKLVNEKKATYVEEDRKVRLFTPEEAQFRNDRVIQLTELEKKPQEEDKIIKKYFGENKKPLKERIAGFISRLSEIFHRDVVKNEGNKVYAPELGPITAQNKTAALEEQGVGSIVFRIQILEDMVDQLREYKPIVGFSFGKPFRSKRLSITRNGVYQYLIDGWIPTHNSLMETVYRTGLIGVGLLILLFCNISHMIKIYRDSKSYKGILLVTSIVYWIIAALFNIIFEMPYFAIPLWSMYGCILAHAHHTRQGKRS